MNLHTKTLYAFLTRKFRESNEFYEIFKTKSDEFKIGIVKIS